MTTLLSNQGKYGVNNGLFTTTVDIEDTSYLSTYFVVAEFNPIFTAGRNSIAFNGSSLLKAGAEIKVQCIDSKGKSLYLEYPKSKTQFVDIANYVVSIHVYNETNNGIGKIILVGTTTKNEVVRWTSNISIDKTLPNISKTRFYSSPTMEARSLLYPVISNEVGDSLTQTIVFTGSCYAIAVTPIKDTIQSYINPRITDIDYRLVYNPTDMSSVESQLYPTVSFNSQMEGQSINIVTDIIQSPVSYAEEHTQISASFNIKKVIDSKTIQLSNAFFVTSGKNNIITNINRGQFASVYKWACYNTKSDSYQQYTPPNGNPIYEYKSYAEISYKNIKPFTGMIARHKLYRKSLIANGEYELIVDGPLGTNELLIDPVTVNKFYSSIGTFYNEFHINKYWFTNSKELQLSHSVSPRINSMRINKASASFDKIDGTNYVIVKIDSIDPIPNDAIYYAYDKTQFDNIQGTSYNSNFIDLKAGSLYALSMNVIIEKDKNNPLSKLSFFFTSSINTIQREKNYIDQFGWKLGEISVTELVATKVFSDKQVFYFTPNFDYYGTMVIIPYFCNAIISDISFGVYSDHGFSPDCMITKIPFPVSIRNEGFQLKAELFDIDSNLVYSNLNTIQTFDANGKSLFTFIGNSNINPSNVTFISSDLTISQSLFIPNIPQSPTSNIRLLSYISPTHIPMVAPDGEVCYTDISNISIVPTNNKGTINSPDYISITTTDGIVDTVGTSISVHYDGTTAGRRIFIDSNGGKHIYY